MCMCKLEWKFLFMGKEYIFIYVQTTFNVFIIENDTFSDSNTL